MAPSVNGSPPQVEFVSAEQLTTLSVPMLDRARTTAPTIPTASRLSSTVRAQFDASRREIFTVLAPMTLDAERQSICHIEPKRFAARPRFQMMSVKITSRDAALASVVISGVHGFAPYPKFGGQPRSVSRQRFSIFKGIAWGSATGAGAGAKSLTQGLVHREDFAAHRTRRWLGGILFVKARLTAKPRSRRSVGEDRVKRSTCRAGQADRFSGWDSHCNIIAHIEPRFVDVARDRYARFVGKPELAARPSEVATQLAQVVSA